jgi:hypothetical protein
MDLRPSGDVLYAVGRARAELMGMLEVDPRRHRARRLGFVREQTIRSPIMVGDRLSFVSTRFDHRLAVRQRDGSFDELPGIGITHASPCGNDLIVDRSLGNGAVAVEIIDRSGQLIRRLSAGPVSGSSSCSPDGKEWFFMEGLAPMTLKRCREGGCRVITERNLHGVSVSPDGRRIAFVTLASRGPLIGWMPVDGGPTHDVTDSETGCPIGWASNQTLWVSRRRDAKIVWTQVDADSGKETGQTVPGQRDCSDGGDDPSSPVNPDLRVTAVRTSQLRLLPRVYLNRP